uniref:Chromosome 18 open reading frame 54 n=1 Tax=Pelusios castaneus TaxID=367368 RepID=A0A8C8VNN4_9SAUR
MACSFKKGNIYSPESTVSSLLASCSLNGSNSSSNGLIHYKDKVYNSASQALEAYIEDFDQIRIGQLQYFEFTQYSFCNLVKELNAKYLFQVKPNSIASSFLRQTVCDPDLISLTTDDLLAFPPDGSLPFIHRTSSRSGLQSSKRIRKSLEKSAFYPYQTSSFDVEKDFDFQDNGNVHFAPELRASIEGLTCFNIELLILKAKRTLESSAESLSSALKNDESPCTVDVLEAERSWENVPVAFKLPVPVHCEEDENSLQSPKANIVNEFLEDCLNNENQENTFSGGNHHGPVEALKLMLFNLQAVHESFNQNKIAEQNDEFKKVSKLLISLYNILHVFFIISI